VDLTPAFLPPQAQASADSVSRTVQFQTDLMRQICILKVKLSNLATRAKGVKPQRTIA
jgi:hypothetical protein